MNKPFGHKTTLCLATAITTAALCFAATPSLASTSPATAIGSNGLTGFNDITGAPTGALIGSEPNVSGDGKVAVFTPFINSDSSVYTLDATNGLKKLGALANTTNYNAHGISNDGSVIAGVATQSSGAVAIQWKAGVASVLPELAKGSQYTSAIGVSGDGHVVVGTSGDGTNSVAVKWVDGAAPVKLGDSTITAGQANAASSDGSVIVGSAQTASMLRGQAFRWTQAGGLVLLGLVGSNNGQLSFSGAAAVSSDGSVVVGNSFDASERSQMFRWTQAGGMVGLGFLTGGNTSYAWATTADGNMVVGDATVPAAKANSFDSTAAVWTKAGGMQSLASYLTGKGITLASGTVLFDANGVSGDGAVIVGTGTIGGTDQPFIVRTGASSGGSTSGGGGTGVVGLSSFLTTVAGSAAFRKSLASMMSMSLHGAHHRTLSDYAVPGSNCAWATGDFGGTTSGDRKQYFGETGLCHAFGETVRAGIGIGYGDMRRDLDLGGKARAHGYNVVGEVDISPKGSPLTLSLLGYYADYSLNTARAYANGANTDTSYAHTGARSWAARARVDWHNALKVGSTSVSPYLGYTHSFTVIDGYTETGGGFPVFVNRGSQSGNETRLGATIGLPLSDKVKLGLSGEWAHHFDDGSSFTSGAMVGGLAPFAFTTGIETKDWGRGGVDLDIRTSVSSVLSFSAHAMAGEGRDADLSGSISYHIGF